MKSALPQQAPTPIKMKSFTKQARKLLQQENGCSNQMQQENGCALAQRLSR
jgi:hypothetical protein